MQFSYVIQIVFQIFEHAYPISLLLGQTSLLHEQSRLQPRSLPLRELRCVSGRDSGTSVPAGEKVCYGGEWLPHVREKLSLMQQLLQNCRSERDGGMHYDARRRRYNG